jgi:uncharacterized membrane protein YoaK (UPF0700 family)
VTDPATSLSSSRRAPATEGLRRVFVDERDGPLPAILLALTLLAGTLDAATILRLGHVFVATITGNLVFLGLAAAGAKGFAVVTCAVVIGGFLVGVLVGGWAYGAARAHRGLALRNVLGVKVVLAATASLTVVVAGEDFSVGVRDTVLVLLSMSMGAQSVAIRYLKVPDLVTVVLTFTITGALTDRGQGWSDPAVLRRWLAIVAFAVGALISALLVLYVALRAVMILGLVIIVSAAVATHLVSRREASWSAPHSV